jgi:hypothetical protein
LKKRKKSGRLVISILFRGILVIYDNLGGNSVICRILNPTYVLILKSTLERTTEINATTTSADIAPPYEMLALSIMEVGDLHQQDFLRLEDSM